MTPSRPARLLTPIGIRWSLVFAVILGGFSASADTALAEKLRRHLETLAAERGFRVEGADLIGDEQGSSRKSDGLAERINQLLANYNFIVTRDTRNRIVQLTIVGLRAPPPASPPETKFIRTEKHQSEHYVEAVLAGPNGRPLPLKFMVDTGASTLVLPQSLAAPLGYAKNQLKSVDVQTANGRTMGLSAMLDSVRVGEAESARVAVTFVDDRLLGGKQLLGMSFLSRFRMTIDASNGLLHLEKQGD